MISKRIYFTIIMMFVTIFALFMFIGISSNLVNDKAANIRADKDIRIRYEDILSPDLLNMELDTELNAIDKKTAAAIISEEKDSTTAGLLIEWCVYHKYRYKVHTSLPDAEDMEDFDILLFGDITLTREDRDTLYSYADLGKTMIFTRLPDYQVLYSDRRMADFFGIEGMDSRSTEADGIKIFSDFMIGGERIYQKDDYFGTEDDTSILVPYYRLRAGYEVYAVGLFDDQQELGIQDRELPPLLWRTKTGNAFVFAINSELFHGVSLLGVMTGFMTHINECYLYPVVNAQTISLLDYPYFSEENEAVIGQIYSRSSDALARDILWPNIIQVLKNYGKSYNFFAASQLDYLDEVGPDEDYVNFYIREINKLPGEMGLSLGQVSEADLADIINKNDSFFKDSLPEYDFSALFLADFSMDAIKKELGHSLLSKISMVISDYHDGDKLIDFIDNKVLSVKFNLDGYRHETRDDIQQKSIYNALGMSNTRVDIGRVIYPTSSDDEWNNLSLIWSRGDTYFKDYADFDMVSMYEMESRVRRFLALDFFYECNNNGMNIQIENFDEEAYFILSVYDKDIVSVDNGEAKRIAENMYLIKAYEPNVQIRLKTGNILKVPANNITIPYDPEVKNPKKK